MAVTEHDWLTGEDAYPLSLHIVRGSARKLRLLAVACARRVPPEFINDDCRRLLDASEASAEERISNAERRKIEKAVASLALQHEEAYRSALHAEEWSSDAYRRYKAISACGMTSQADRFMIRLAMSEAIDASADPAAEKRYQCAVLRDIYGNPFHPVNMDSSWKSPEVAALAAAIDAIWNPADFPNLAKALANAGCRNETILNHCRESGPHVRGCWVIDLILGKK